MRIRDNIELNTDNIECDFEKNIKVTFIRVDPEDKKETLKEIFNTLTDLSWINKFQKDYIRDCFQVRAEKTINRLKDKLDIGVDDNLTSEAGQYLVVGLSRKVLIKELNYAEIPLAELFKEITAGNPGFDFHSENLNDVIIFGESKYIARDNAYNSALKQVVEFIDQKKDVGEIVDLKEFVKLESLDNFSRNRKGYAVGFSSHSIDTDTLINNVMQNPYFLELLRYEELVIIAVDVNATSN